MENRAALTIQQAWLDRCRRKFEDDVRGLHLGGIAVDDGVSDWADSVLGDGRFWQHYGMQEPPGLSYNDSTIFVKKAADDRAAITSAEFQIVEVDVDCLRDAVLWKVAEFAATQIPPYVRVCLCTQSRFVYLSALEWLRMHIRMQTGISTHRDVVRDAVLSAFGVKCDEFHTIW